jgi:autotransporter strand-loop-strand O-heptosyltransferase
MKVRAHTCYLGHTGFASHARNFFRELSKHVDLRVRNYTWDSNPQLDEIDYSILDKITLSNSDNTQSDYPISHSFPDLPWIHKQDFKQDIDIVLMDMHHKYFYDDYTAPIKIAYTVWESTELEQNFFNQLLKFDYLWVVSVWHKEMAIKQGYPEERISIVNEGVDSEFFEPIEPKNDKFRFLFFGRWDYRKALPEIIESFIKAFPDNNDIELILSADNPYSIDGFSSTEERLEHYGLTDDRIRVIHFPTRSEYIDYIKNGNVLITCARSEGWNIPLIEAMAAGTPSIYSNWGAQLEFAGGLGNPVKISRELPANVGRDLGFAGDTPGLYAEPDFSDLRRVLLDCYDNYRLKKKIALKESKIIQKNFTWTKIGLDGIRELRKASKSKEAVVIMSHSDTDEKLSTLKKNIESTRENGFSVILSSHIDVPNEILSMCDYVVIDRENPVVYNKESKIYTSHILFTYWDYADFRVVVPFKYNHSYAALKLIKNGLALSEYNGFEKIHFINYDYIINYETLDQHSKLLDDNDLVGYKWDSYGGLSINTGFFSSNINLAKTIKNINSKKTFYSDENVCILEDVIGSAISNSGLKYDLSSIEKIKESNTINMFELPNRWMSESGCIGGKFNKSYYIFTDGKKDVIIKTESNTLSVERGKMNFIKVEENDIISGVVVTNENKSFEDVINMENCIGEFEIRKFDLIRDINNKEIKMEESEFIIDYNNGPFVEILGGSDFLYSVSFINDDNGSILYETTLNRNCWCRCSIQYYIKWRIEIKNLTTGKVHTDIFKPEGKNITIKLDSSSLGDNIAWMPIANEFAEKHGCQITLTTFKNFIFDSSKYPNITFIEPHDSIKSYATYNIGWFYGENGPDLNRNPRDFKNIPLQSAASDILGLSETTVKPSIKINDSSRPLEKKYICIAIHSTAQAKYWNNPTGWQGITDYLISKGYEVVIVSSEEDGYMGNKNPKGAIYMEDNSMDTLIKYLNHCEVFIGISSGISWLSWALGKITVIISGFSNPITEPIDGNVIRVFNDSVCNGCFNTHRLDPSDWNWCPINKGTHKQFECSKSITWHDVAEAIESGKSSEYKSNIKQTIRTPEIEFIPNKRDYPKLAEQPLASAWGNIPTILKDIIDRFDIDTKRALEFGVEYGYSTSAISAYFDEVIGVDIFTGDIHSGLKNDHLIQTLGYLEPFKKISLIKADYVDFIRDNEEIYGLTHIDIVHDFEHTYECGEWAVQHSRVTIFHDTESFPEVKRACQELADNFDLEFYNYKESYGLGILVNRRIASK